MYVIDPVLCYASIVLPDLMFYVTSFITHFPKLIFIVFKATTWAWKQGTRYKMSHNPCLMSCYNLCEPIRQQGICDSQFIPHCVIELLFETSSNQLFLFLFFFLSFSMSLTPSLQNLSVSLSHSLFSHTIFSLYLSVYHSYNMHYF